LLIIEWLNIPFNSNITLPKLGQQIVLKCQNYVSILTRTIGGKKQFKILLKYLVCKDLNEGRLAVIGIGNNPTLYHLESITTILNIPYISIKWNDNYDSELLVGSNKKNSNKKDDEDENYIELDENYANIYEDDENQNIFSLNMHTPSSKIMNAIVDLTDHYKWDFVTILFQESLGLEHIQDLIRIPSLTHIDKGLRTQVRQLSGNINEWIYLLKDVKLSGSSHIIVDIETKYINEFIRQVERERLEVI
jgi:hypothetical protein